MGKNENQCEARNEPRKPKQFQAKLWDGAVYNLN